MKQEFNLLEEPWIRMRMPDCSVHEVSIRDALRRAPEAAGLAGETKTQDFAVLRLLLAILYTVFTRYDPEGRKVCSEDLTEDDMLDLWQEIWQRKSFPSAPFDAYFAEWEDRFWLFDETHPFGQCTTVSNRNMISTGKMIGSLFESGHKKRLFSGRTEEGRLLDYGESARWLLHLNCFDDTAAKDPVPKRTYVGPLRLIALEGSSFFETLMLNFVVVSDHQSYLSQPAWEQDNNITEYNRIIPMPLNQAALLTIPSRRVLLHRSENSGKVDGYMLSGGDYIVEKDVYAEQETCWGTDQKKKQEPYHFFPKELKRGDTVRKAWQEFGMIAAVDTKDETDQGKRAPGVIRWMKFLLSKEIISESQMVQLSMAAVVYNSGQAASYPVVDCVSDGLTFHSKLLMDAGYTWRLRIREEIEKCDRVAKAIGDLYKEIQFAAGRRDKDNKTMLSGEEDVMVRFYTEIDRTIRDWLRNLDAQKEEDYVADLEKPLRRKALQLGSECMTQAGSMTIFGEGASSAKVYNDFLSKINRVFEKGGK